LEPLSLFPDPALSHAAPGWSPLLPRDSVHLFPLPVLSFWDCLGFPPHRALYDPVERSFILSRPSAPGRSCALSFAVEFFSVPRMPGCVEASPVVWATRPPRTAVLLSVDPRPLVPSSRSQSEYEHFSFRFLSVEPLPLHPEIPRGELFLPAFERLFSPLDVDLVMRFQTAFHWRPVPHILWFESFSFGLGNSYEFFFSRREGFFSTGSHISPPPSPQKRW